MSLTVTQRPESTLGSKTSTWNCVRNPVVYKMQRKDFTFNQINDNGGDIQVQINGIDVTTSFTVGDTIYIQSDNDVYDLFAEITASAFSGGNTLVTVDSAYISAAPGGFVNNDDLRVSYRVEVEVYNGDDEIIGDTHIYSPTTKGYLLIDVSEIVKSVITPEIEADLTGSTEVFTDEEAHEVFYIKYTEVWTGSAESQNDDVNNKFNVITGARQIPSTYGGNLLEYVVVSQFAESWESQTPAEVNAWRHVIYASSLFVAVSSDGVNRVMTSPDGITWTSRAAAAANAWESLIFGNSLFVAVASSGAGNRVMTSPDTITWTIRTSAADDNWQDIAYGASIYVAVARGGAGTRVMTSPDGVTWTTRTPATTNSWQAIAFGASLFIAINNDASAATTVMTSPDGITWTSRVGTDTGWVDVAWNGTYFVAVGANGVMRSTDGITWTPGTESSDHAWSGVWFCNSATWVATATDGASMFSMDNGETWTDIDTEDLNVWTSIAFGNGTFVAVAPSVSSNRVMTLSAPSQSDGEFLTKLDRPVFWRGYPYLISAIVSNTDVFLSASVDNTVSTLYQNNLLHFDLNEIVTDQTVDSFNIVLKSGSSEVSNTLTVDVLEPCSNPILLIGRNSLGGALCWLFDISQEEDFNYSDGIKRKRQVLSAAGLTKNQWDALHDFMTLGDVYKENITELLSTTNKTHKRIDQQLYVVDEDGNKIGVVAVPTRNRTRTKLSQHYFEIEIEYPEQF